MKRFFKPGILFVFFLHLFLPPASAQQRSVLNGYIWDENGEVLIGANIFIDSLLVGSTSNAYGFYSIGLPPGDYEVTFSFIGYEKRIEQVNLRENRTLNITLKERTESLPGVEIAADRHHSQLSSLRMSSNRISSQQLKQIPSIAGEPDLIKAIQLLPGIQATNEGLSSYIVRGGNYDQNLVILDEAIVYNPTHLLGFFSIFNSDILKDSRIYKGDIPAQYGGRLSSLLKVSSKEGNNNRFSGSGGIGTILSKITLEMPVLKKKGSVLFSGRRSYADIFLPLSKDEDVKYNRTYFYDVYLKANYRANEKNQFFLSGYLGRDVFKYKNEYYVTWGNITGSFRWNRLFSSRLFSNLSVIYSQYDYRLGQVADIRGVEWNAGIADLRVKYDFTYYANPSTTIRFGATSSYKTFKPGFIIAASDSSIFNDFKIPESQTLEHAVYISNEHKINARLFIAYGLRASLFQNVGGATIYQFDDNFVKVDSAVYAPGEFFNTYWGLEPRLSIKYLLTGTSSLKASYNRTMQFIHLVSNSTTGTPIDIWLPSNPNIKPQKADQVALGYVKSFEKPSIEVTIETYYKTLTNQIDYKDHADIVLNPEMEGELRFGTAKAYGVELMATRTTGALRGLISYSLSKAEKDFPDINNGQPFPSNYDRRHQFSLMMSYDLKDRWSFSSQWLFLSGAPATFPVGRYEFGNIVVPIFSERNAYRLPPYHRLDVGATLKSIPKKSKRLRWELNFSVYNVYNRKNAWFYFFESTEDNELVTEAYKLYLFPIVPSVSFNFKW
jgi:hypothetical protein